MSICDVPVISGVCDVIGDTAAAVVSAPFDWMGQAAANTAAWLFETVWSVIDSTTLVDVTSGPYVAVYNVLFGIGVFVMLIFFFLQLGTGLIRRDPRALRHALLGLARAILGSFLVLTLTGTLLEITDQLTIGLVQASGNTMETLGDKIAVLTLGLTAVSITSPGVTAILLIFFGFLAIAAAVIVWFSMLIRKALLLAAIVLAPLALSGTVWEHTKGWVGKWASFVIALILSKLVVMVIFLVATAQLAAPIDFDISTISDPVSGIVLMMLAGFAPYLTYKLVAFMGFDIYQTMSMEQEAKQAAQRPLPFSSRPVSSDSAKKVLGSGDDNATPAETPTTTPSTAPAAVPTTAGTGAASTAGAETATTGTASATASAAPVVGGIILGAKAGEAVVTAGPKAGAMAGGQAEQQASASAPSTPQPVPPPAQPAPVPAQSAPQMPAPPAPQKD